MNRQVNAKQKKEHKSVEHQLRNCNISNVFHNMGNTVAIPKASELERVHKVDPRLPALGDNHGAPISTTNQIKVVVKEKLFSWSGDSFKIKYEDGSTFGNDLEVRGKVFAIRDQMAIFDGTTKQPVAVCLRSFVFCGQIFKIYTTSPVYKGQEKSAQKYNNLPLYTYGTIERDPCSMEQRLRLANGGTGYTIHRAGSLWPKKRVVRKEGVTCALMAGGTWDLGFNAYRITVNPGIDACLMILLCCVCDEMDEAQN